MKMSLLFFFLNILDQKMHLFYLYFRMETKAGFVGKLIFNEPKELLYPLEKPKKKLFFLAQPLRGGGGKGWVTKKNNFFRSSKKNSDKARGAGGGPLKK